MPIQVSLFDLVKKPGTEDLWPADFKGKIEKLIESPNEKTTWGVIADWLDENDEPRLADGFRWFSTRPSVEVYRTAGKSYYWYFAKLPSSVMNAITGTSENVPNLVTCLVEALEKVRKEVN